ncbi:hypothetical protein GRI58_12995 [Porphyrobacter algicida]|uniref:Aspartyl protease n=2 Tax=Qipengyuania algicida TaxID=1836209 RepID=A0A845ALI4_9SPHN|nr:retropepsin-like aspartic protease [Qipengyuania algicida]MXP29725.1 hypothetical protein [Qipengyuania algicida]
MLASVVAISPLAANAAGATPTRASGGHENSACELVNSAKATAQTNIPIRVIDGRVYVQASVNGQGPFTFAVDTGASGFGRADIKLVSKLHLKFSGERSSSDGVSTSRAKVVRIETLRLGQHAVHDVSVMARDYSKHMSSSAPFAGILGRKFFADGLLIIDYPERRLIFTRSEGLAVTDRDSLPYDRPFRVKVTIGSVETRGNLDTGANISFVLPQSLFATVADGHVGKANLGQLTNTTIKTNDAKLKAPIQIGLARFSGADVRVSSRFPELLVGARALQNYTLLIDQRSSRIALCPPA